MPEAAAAETPEPSEATQGTQPQPGDTDAPQEGQEAAQPRDPQVEAEGHRAIVHRLLREASDVTSPARYQWEQEQITALRQTVAKDCNNAQFVMFLEVAARYQLDPFAKQIWAAKMSDRPDDVAIIVGRDGLLAIAERYPQFERVASAEVVKGDKLYVDERGCYVHEWGDDHLTGEIIGAWAEVYRSDRTEPQRFYARMSEYNKPGGKIWGKYKSSMIQKVAQATALRLAFSISGIVVEEEVGGTGPNAGLLTAPTTIEWGDDEHLATWLKALVRVANEVKPNSYRERKLLALLRGRTDEERRTFAQELSEHIVGFRGEVPEPPLELAVDVEEDGTLTWEVDGTLRVIASVVEPGVDEARDSGEPEPAVDAEALPDDGEPVVVSADVGRTDLDSL